MAARQARGKKRPRPGKTVKKVQKRSQPKPMGRPRKYPEGEKPVAVTVRLPPDLHRAVKHYCIDQPISQTDLIIRLLREEVGM